MQYRAQFRRQRVGAVGIDVSQRQLRAIGGEFARGAATDAADALDGDVYALGAILAQPTLDRR